MSANVEPPIEKVDEDGAAGGEKDTEDANKISKEERVIGNNFTTFNINNNLTQNARLNSPFENQFLSGNIGVFSSLPDDIFTN